MNEPDLNTTPSFVYEQLDEGEATIERAIEVIYWNGSIELRQDGRYVLIQNDDIKKLFRLVLKHLPDAIRIMDKP